MSNPFLDILKKVSPLGVAFPAPKKGAMEFRVGENLSTKQTKKAEQKVKEPDYMAEARYANSPLGFTANVVKGIPKTTANVFKEILQGTARTVGTVGVTAGNIPKRMSNATRFGDQIELLPSEIPTDQTKVGRVLFGGKPIRDIPNAGANAARTIDAFRETLKGGEVKPTSSKFNIPLGIAGSLIDLTGFGGKAGVKAFTAGEIPEQFLKYVAKEKSATVLEDTLKGIGLDDINAKSLSLELAPTKQIDEVKDVLLKYTSKDANPAENPFINTLKGDVQQTARDTSMFGDETSSIVTNPIKSITPETQPLDIAGKTLSVEKGTFDDIPIYDGNGTLKGTIGELKTFNEQGNLVDKVPTADTAGNVINKTTENIPTVQNSTALSNIEKDIPLDVAIRAHAGTSFTPEKRGASRVQEYVQYMKETYDDLQKLAKTTEQKTQLDEMFTRFRDGYRKRKLAILSTEARSISPMISGPARFPVARNRKVLDSAHNKYVELGEYEDKALKAIKRELSGTKIITGTKQDAIDAETQILADMRSEHERMKLINKIIRSGKNVTERLINETKLPPEAAAEIQKPDYAGRKGFAAYQLTNFNAQIKAKESKIAMMSKKRQIADTIGNTTEKFDGGTVVRNFEEDRLQIHFDSKPDEAMRSLIKSKGFHWSPTNGVWQRKLTPDSIRAIKQLFPDLKKVESTSEKVTNEPKEEVKSNTLIEEAKKYKSVEDFIKSQGDIFYHTTPVTFDKFDKSFLGSNTNFDNTRIGFYFADNLKQIADFKNILEKGFGGTFTTDAIKKTPEELAKYRTIEKITKKENFFNFNYDAKDLTASEARDFAEFAHKKMGGLYNLDGDIVNDKEMTDAQLGKFLKEDVFVEDLDPDSSFLPRFTDEYLEDFVKFLEAKGYKGMISNYGKGTNEYLIFDPNILPTKSELTDIYKKAHPEVKPVVYDVPGLRTQEEIVAEKARIAERDTTKKQPSNSGLSEADRLIAQGKIRVVSRNGRDVYQVKKGTQWMNARDEDSAVKQATKVREPVKKPEMPEEIQKKEMEVEQLSMEISRIEDNVDQLPGKILKKFVSKKEGDFLDFKNMDVSRISTQKDANLYKRNKEVMRQAEKAFEGTAQFDQYDDPDTIRNAIDEYNTTKERLARLKIERAKAKQELSKEKLAVKDEQVLNKIAEKETTKTENEIKKAEQKREQNTRIEEKKRAFEEGQKNALEKQRTEQERLENRKKAFETQGKKLGFFGHLGQALDPVKYLEKETKTILQSWNKELIQAKVKANKEIGSFLIPEKDGMKIIHDFQAGIKTPYTDIIKSKFDDFLEEARKRGVDVKEKKNYLPQVYKETPSEIQTKIEKYFMDKGMTVEEANAYVNGKKLSDEKVNRLGLNPFFTKESSFPSYKVAMEYGLTPKYTHPDQLAAYYREQLEKGIANRKLIDTLVSKAKILPVESAPNNWKPVELPFSQKGYYADSKLAKVLNGIFKSEDDVGILDVIMKGIADVSKKAQEITLSAGVPYTNINFFSMGQTIKEMTAGNFKAGLSFLRANSDSASAQWVKNKQSIIEKMAEEGLDLRSTKFSYDQAYKNMVAKPKFAEILGKHFDRAFNEKTFQSFIPQMQVQLFEDIYKGALKNGLADGEAQKLAADTIRKNFGLNEFNGRSKLVEDSLSATFFAPKFREGIINTLYNTGKSGFDFVKQLGGARGKMDPTLNRNRRLLLGMLITYALYNALNKEINGNYMWENPENRKFALRIPRKNGEVVYVEFMPSFLAFARNMFSGAIALGKGDIKTGTQKFGSVFSMPVKISSEIFANSDYFGNPIYKPYDSGGIKALKIAKYVGLQVNHPYVKETINQIQDKKPLYQSLTAALEFPLKYSTEDKEEASRIFNAVDDQNKEKSQLKDKAERLFKELDQLEPEEADAKAEEIYNSDPELYQKLIDVANAKRLDLQPNEKYMLSLNIAYRAKYIYEKVKKMETDEEKDAYISNLSEKKIITDATYEEIAKLAEADNQ